ncbi:hypothetical protein ACA910_021718 [Epithemia clementina (nom. ined.)]
MDNEAPPSCPPVRDITIQREAAEASSEITNAGTDSENAFLGHPAFELMQVSITLYGITGILCRTKSDSKPKRSRGKKKETLKKILNESKTGGAVDQQHQQIGPSSTISSTDSLTTYCAVNQPPLTAVVSYMKNIFSSGTTMETYVPSRPVVRLSRCEAPTLEYAARWPGWEDGKDLDDRSHTFTVARVMKQQHYQATKMAKVSTHVHETIELCVFAGRGRELIPLGVASFVITGDEEEEVVHNTPVRLPRPGTSSFDKHFVVSKKNTRRKQKTSFLHSPKHSYELDSNAILQLGVRVFPQSTLAKASAREAADRAAEERIFKEVLNELLGESFNDDDEYAKSQGARPGGDVASPDVSEAIQEISRKLDMALPSNNRKTTSESQIKDAKHTEKIKENAGEIEKNPFDNENNPFDNENNPFNSENNPFVIKDSIEGTDEFERSKDVANDTKGKKQSSNHSKDNKSNEGDQKRRRTKKDDEGDQKRQSSKKDDEGNHQLTAIANLFCGLDMCSSAHSEHTTKPILRVSTRPTNVLDSEVSKVLSPGPTVALPLSLVSSVSDSVSTRGSTPNHFYPSRILSGAR